MGRHLDKLVSLGSPALSSARAVVAEGLGGGSGRRAELTGLLRKRNGFLAFESALIVFPAGAAEVATVPDLASWNAADSWVASYGPALDPGILWFAADVFGGGFGLAGERVVRLDPETGESEPIAASVEGWAERILDDMEQETGYPLAHAWQAAHGALRPGDRLVPDQPFVLGGDYVVANLHAAEAIAAMRRYGAIAQQLVGAVDGADLQVSIPALPTRAS